MNIQQQDINVIQHETKWQAPALTELGKINNETQSGPQFNQFDGASSMS